MKTGELIARIRHARCYENLAEYLPSQLGADLYLLVAEADKMDKELDLVHKAITELYELDGNAPIIKDVLDKIKLI
jgi:chaperonin cofactor prefoldin